MSLVETAPAKINLALHVRRRCADGYHDLETVFAFTAFGDTLRFSDAATLSLAMTGPWAGAVEGANLVLRAARALATAAGIEPRGTISLDKHIPVAAGLGGGSADAAATLRLLNRAWAVGWTLDRLLPIATALGADVPACLVGGTSFGTGRGETLVAVDAGIAGTAIVLVNPRVAVATGPVFAAWDRFDRGPLEASGWRAGRNDLAQGATAVAPVIADVLDTLAATGAGLVRMSGSGATCFALYADAETAEAAVAMLRRERPDWWSLATRVL